MLRICSALAALLLLVAPSAAQPAADMAAITSCLDKGDARKSCIGLIANPCLEIAENQTTVGMVQCEAREAAVWDRLLNIEYQRLLKLLDAEQQAALRKGQRAWIAYRDERCAFYHILIRGTMAQPIGAGCVARMTAERVLDLMGYQDFLQ